MFAVAVALLLGVLVDRVALVGQAVETGEAVVRGSHRQEDEIESAGEIVYNLF